MLLLSNINEWRLTLIAWIQGRRGVLDDFGHVIESESELTDIPEIPDEINAGESHSVLIDHSNEDETSRQRVWIVRVKTVLCYVILAGLMVMFLGWSWNFTGWIGRKLLNIPGAVGNLAGLIAIVGVFFVWAVASTRLDNAREFRRASRGTRNVHDRLTIYSCLQIHKICPACSFSLENHLEDVREVVRCSECGARWIPRYWLGFLQIVRVGVHRTIRRKSARRKSCLVDARDQMYVVLNQATLAQRLERVRQTPTPGVWRSQFLAVLCFLPLIVGIIVVMLWAIGFTQGNAILIMATVFTPILIMVMIIVFRTYLDTARTRRLKQLGCDLIDQGVCGGCGSQLDLEPHVVDGALACEQCGLFFDPQTTDRKHHCRRRIPWDRYKTDRVFDQI